MSKIQKARDGDIVINLQDTLGGTGLVQASMTKQVLSIWAKNFGCYVQEFRQADPRESSIRFELIFITPQDGVNRRNLESTLRSVAQTFLSEQYTAVARHP